MARLRPVDLVIAPFVFRLREPFEPRPSEEVRSVHWVPLRALAAEENRGTHAYEHGGVRLQVPAVRWGGLVIWGLTYRMCTGLLERLRAAPPSASEAPA